MSVHATDQLSQSTFTLTTYTQAADTVYTFSHIQILYYAKDSCAPQLDLPISLTALLDTVNNNAHNHYGYLEYYEVRMCIHICEHISETTHSDITKLFVHVVSGRGWSFSGSVTMLCISGFVDHQCFLITGPIAQKILYDTSTVTECNTVKRAIVVPLLFATPGDDMQKSTADRHA